jgi:hypothetical protein
MLNGDGPTRRYDLSPLRFDIPEHVRDRCEERLGYRPSREEIRQQCFDAIWRGRWSTKQPEWLNSGDRLGRGAVFAWPDDRSYAFVVSFGRPRAEIVRIYTVLIPTPHNSGLREQLKRWVRANRGEDAA